MAIYSPSQNQLYLLAIQSTGPRNGSATNSKRNALEVLRFLRLENTKTKSQMRCIHRAKSSEAPLSHRTANNVQPCIVVTRLEAFKTRCRSPERTARHWQLIDLGRYSGRFVPMRLSLTAPYPKVSPRDLQLVADNNDHTTSTIAHPAA